MPRRDELKRQIAEIDELLRTGVLSGKQAKARRAQLEAELLAAIAGSATGAVPAANSAAPARPSLALKGGVAAFVVLFGIAGYFALGNFEGWSVAPGATPAAGAEAQQGHASGNKEFEAMAQRLQQKLEAKPDDPDGWAMLGRTQAVLGKHAEAVVSLRKSIGLRPNDAQVLADLADSVAMVNGRSLQGEPEQLVARAVQIDPGNVKALSLAGTIAFAKGDAKLAAQHWSTALSKVEAGSEIAERLQSAVNDARSKAGLPPMAAASGAGPRVAAAPPAPQAAPGPGSVSGRISLAPSLAASVQPGDTLYVFARPANGTRVPVAIMRRQARELPLDFTLDDSMSMSPDARLSTAGQVVVGARISRSGSPTAQPGDLQVLTQAVPVGSRNLKLEIAETVR